MLHQAEAYNICINKDAIYFKYHYTALSVDAYFRKCGAEYSVPDKIKCMYTQHT